MGALPKNKITRVERGRRRKGNTPQLRKDPKRGHMAQHKQGLVAQILQSVGLQLDSKQKTN